MAGGYESVGEPFRSPTAVLWRRFERGGKVWGGRKLSRYVGEGGCCERGRGRGRETAAATPWRKKVVVFEVKRGGADIELEEHAQCWHSVVL